MPRAEARAQTVHRFDFTSASQAREWQAAHDIAVLRAVPEGLQIRIGGSDPYIHGPARDYTEGQPLWLRIRLISTAGGLGRAYYFTDAHYATEATSVRFPVPAGKWTTVQAPLPALGPATHLRFDPPGTSGLCTVAWIEVSRRQLPPAVKWPPPAAPAIGRDSLSVRSGDLTLTQAHHQDGGFEVRVAGALMARGYAEPPIVYQAGGHTRVVTVGSRAIVTAAALGAAVVVRSTLRDPDGATWRIEQRFAPAPAGAIEASSLVSVDRDREVLFLPLMILLPGAGSFGAAKHQAIFGGLEYLGPGEPSSSEKDIRGAGHLRQVPDVERITLPLMAVQQGARAVGLAWKLKSGVAAVFDSPDRLFRAGGHVMGLIFPGSDGTNRGVGSLLPYQPATMRKGESIGTTAFIVGGRAESVAPLVQQSVELLGLPGLPKSGLSWPRYADLARSGWVTSGIREGGLFHHALPNFPLQPAADAALDMAYLQAQDPVLRIDSGLAQAEQLALAAVPAGQRNASGIGHVRYPAASLAFGAVLANAGAARAAGLAELKRFSSDGQVEYIPSGKGPDLAATNGARESDGMTAQAVCALLEDAIAAGDSTLQSNALRKLHGLDRYDQDVPRGAQPWEVPIHTPDILACAYLCKAYVLGYRLSGDKEMLKRAVYWAWTGVPFVYLRKPAGGPVGPYATVPVLGASNYVAPDWMGLPVQWCGLVYADALYDLAPLDPGGPWRRLADGITICGIQQTWPERLDPQRVGLLPDSYNLKSQTRNDPAINPATLFPEAVRLYRRIPLYSVGFLPGAGIESQAPGRIATAQTHAHALTVTITPWCVRPYWVLTSGLKRRPEVTVDGRPVAARDLQWLDGLLAVRLQGKAKVVVQP